MDGIERVDVTEHCTNESISESEKVSPSQNNALLLLPDCPLVLSRVGLERGRSMPSIRLMRLCPTLSSSSSSSIETCGKYQFLSKCQKEGGEFFPRNELASSNLCMDYDSDHRENGGQELEFAIIKQESVCSDLVKKIVLKYTTCKYIQHSYKKMFVVNFFNFFGR